MTTSQAIKIIKEELKVALPNFLFKKDIGGNLYFFKEKENNFYHKLVITIFKSGGRYMITASFELANNLVEIIYYLIQEYKAKYNVGTRRTLMTYAPYTFADVYIESEPELKRWIIELQSKFDEGFTSLKASSSLAYLEANFNRAFLDKKVSSFTDIYEHDVIRGVILAKLLNKSYYEELVNKAYKVYEHLRSVVDENYTDDNIVKTVKLLDNFTIAQLNDIEYLKKQIE